MELGEFEGGSFHYNRWNKNFLNKTIQMCGLASSKWPNLKKKRWIMKHLHETEMPLHPGERLQTLTEMGKKWCAGASHKEIAWLLLQWMAPGLPDPKEPAPAIALVTPTRELLQRQAHVMIWDKIFCKDIVPYYYDVPDRRHLWTVRREVRKNYCIISLLE